MIEGDSFGEVSEYRKSFFAEVIDKAKEVGLCISIFSMWG